MSSESFLLCSCMQISSTRSFLIPTKCTLPFSFSRAHQFALSKFHSFFPNISCRFLYFHYFLECLSLACRGFVLETNTCVITWYRSLRSLGSLIVFCLRARGTKSGFLECLVVLQRLGDSSEFLLSSLEESQLRVQISMVTRRV